MVALAQKLLNNEEISAPLDLGVEGYEALEFKEGSETVFEGQGWVLSEKTDEPSLEPASALLAFGDLDRHGGG